MSKQDLMYFLKQWCLSESSYEEEQIRRNGAIISLIKKSNEIFSFSPRNEKAVIYLFSTELQKLCQKCIRNFKIEVTALGLFRRVFMKKNLFEANPTLVMKAAILTAAKIENLAFEHDDQFNALLKKMNFTSLDFVKTELKILEYIKYSIEFFETAQLFEYVTAKINIENLAIKEGMLSFLRKFLCTEYYFLESHSILVLVSVYRFSHLEIREFINLFECSIPRLEEKILFYSQKKEEELFFSNAELREGKEVFEKLKKLAFSQKQSFK